MQKIIFFVAFFVIYSNLSAQVYYYQIQNPNIGFGKMSNTTTNPKMDFCINGPLVGGDGLPVGGYIDNGIVMKSWSVPEGGGGNFAVDNAIFGLGVNGTLYMVPYSERNNLPQMRWAFQNGPLLVKNGTNVRGTSQSKYARSGLGVKTDGTLVAIVSIAPVTFYEFADMFVKENCTNAIYLDGGPYVGCSDKNGSYGTLVVEATKLQFYSN